MQERRQHIRMHLDDLMAKMYRESDGMEIDFCPINVSSNGFSIYSAQQLGKDSNVILVLKSGKIKLQVVWCKAKEEDPSAFRVGLSTTNTSDKLDELIKNELEI